MQTPVAAFAQPEGVRAGRLPYKHAQAAKGAQTPGRRHSQRSLAGSIEVRKVPHPGKQADHGRHRSNLSGRLKAWFVRQSEKRVRFELRGLQLHVLFEHPDDTAARLLARGVKPPEPKPQKSPQPPAAPVVAVAAQAPEPTEVANWRLGLVEVLERHPRARKVLRHLDLFEGALRHHGANALDMLPPPVLRKTADQLDTVLDAGAPRGLIGLRAALDVTLIKREPRAVARGRTDLISDFNAGSRLEVEEVGESTFLAAQQRWGRATGY